MSTERDELDKLAEKVQEDLDKTIKGYGRLFDKEFGVLKLVEKGDLTESAGWRELFQIYRDCYRP